MENPSEEDPEEVLLPERPSETIPSAMPIETIPMPGETIGNQAPGVDTYSRPSETIGGQPGTNSIVIPVF